MRCPADFELVAHPIELAGPGDFFSAEYLACIQRKIELVIESLRAHRGEVFIWSDVDIIFLRPIATEVTVEIEAPWDARFSSSAKVRERKRINGGFYVVHATEPLERFFRMAHDELATRPQVDDQYVFNERLPTVGEFRWGYLPLTYYARTHGWPPPKELAIYHANETAGPDGVGQKIKQFEELLWMRRHGRAAVLLTSLTKIPKRLRRWKTEFARRFAR